MSAVSPMERALFGPVDRGRVFAIERLVYGLLAFDLWLEMASHGSRYGAGGLNVAHFAWLDRVQGLPGASTYLAVILASGVFSLSLCLGVGGRPARWVLFGLYTYGWAMSQLDSYQHHFFLSIVLFHFALAEPEPRTPSSGAGCAWPYQLLLASIAIVYAYTGLSKTEEAWLMGDVLVRINASGGKLAPFLELAQGLGLSTETFWWLGGHSVVLAQWILVAAYVAVFLDPGRERRSTPWLASAGLLTAFAFHGGAEYLELRVGWFSSYMVILALVMLGPAAPWREMNRLARRGDELFSGVIERSLWTVPILSSLSLLVAAWSCATLVDLPSVSAMGISAIVLWVHGWRSSGEGRRIGWIGTRLVGILVVATLSLTQSTVHYDFYRFLGGDLVRRGEPMEALDAYGLANTWAPEGEGRQSKVRKIQGSLRAHTR